MGLFDPILNRLASAVKSALGPFGKLWDFITHFWTTLTNAISGAKTLGALVFSEVQQWKNFKEAIPFRTGVISVPKAIEQTQDLISQVVSGWHAILDLVNNIRQQIDQTGVSEDPAAEAREALDDIEHGGLSNLFTKFPKLAQGCEKVLGWFAAVLGIAEAFVTVVEDLTQIVEATKAIREEVETGSTVFLSQKNPRRTVTTTDGDTLKLRVGNLHS